MTTENQHTIHTIDATGRALGRVASEAATMLMGKHRVSYERNKPGDTSVVITNASKLKIPARKREGKKYTTHSGYPGSQRTETLDQVVTKKGFSEAVRRAVRGMLPDNKLRKIRLKNLTISE